MPTVIDFEDLDAGPVSDTFIGRDPFKGNTYADRGISFSNPKGVALYIAPGGLPWNNASNSLSIGAFPYDPNSDDEDDDLIVTFAPPVVAAGFSLIENDPTDQGEFVQFLDVRGDVIREVALPLGDAFVGIVSVDRPIAVMRIEEARDDGDDVAYDDFFFVPRATVNADPALYDNLNNPTYDGRLNPGRWRWNEAPGSEAYQTDGVLKITQQKSPGGEEFWTSIGAVQYSGFSIDRPYFFEAKLNLDTPESNNSEVGFGIWIADDGLVACGIRAYQPSVITCWFEGVNYEGEHIKIVDYQASLYQWYKVRMEINPVTKALTIYVDGKRTTTQEFPQPEDPSKTLSEIIIDAYYLWVWMPPEHTGVVTGYVDDVRIGPIE
jgi:hypothetical protein